MAGETIEVLNPRGRLHQTAIPLAPRPASLDGLRPGILENRKANARLLLERLVEGLRERHRARPDGAALQERIRARARLRARGVRERGRLRARRELRLRQLHDVECPRLDRPRSPRNPDRHDRYRCVHRPD